jgi:predicted nucleic acid-binding protein
MGLGMTDASEVLKNISLLGIDTAPVIYFVERHPKYVTLVHQIFGMIDQGVVTGISSVITLAEVLTLPCKAENANLKLKYQNLLLNSKNFNLIPVDAIAAQLAAELRAKYDLRTPDAIQISVSINAGCQAFLTNDTLLKKVTEIKMLVLDDYI